MSDLSPEARALLEAASRADDPTAGDRERVGRSLASALGVAVLAPAAAQASSVVATSAMSAGALKVAAVAAVLLAAGAGTGWSRRPVPPPRAVAAQMGARVSTPVAVAVPVVVASPVAVAVAAPIVVGVEPTQPAPFVAARPPPLAAPAPRDAPVLTVDSLRAESELLGEAHRALGAGDPSRALALLTTYRERFRHGALREERDVELVLVLCRLGHDDEASIAARRFLRAHPRSPLAPRVQGSCARTTGAEPR